MQTHSPFIIYRYEMFSSANYECIILNEYFELPLKFNNPYYANPSIV